MVLWKRLDPHPSPPGGGSGTGSRLLHYFSTTRVDSRGLRWIPVDSTAANKRLTSNVLDHKLRVVSQLPKHARTGSTPAAFTAIEPCSPSRIRPVGRKSRNPPEPISTGRRRGPTSGIRVRARVRSAAALPRRRARVFCPAVIRPFPAALGPSPGSFSGISVHVVEPAGQSRGAGIRIGGYPCAESRVSSRSSGNRSRQPSAG